MLMDKMKSPRNFTMSRENMKAILEAFKAILEAFKVGRSVVDMTHEFFHAVSPTVASRTVALVSSRALVPVVKGFRSAASRAFTQGKAPGSFKSSATLRSKSTSTPASWEPITINESIESGSNRGLRSLLLQLNLGRLLALL